MATLQHACKCGSDKVSMMQAGGGRGTKDSLFFTGQCEACGFSIEHLPENSDGRLATAIRDWNREVKSRTGDRRPQTRKTASPEKAPTLANAVCQAVGEAEAPAEYRSHMPAQLRTLVLACPDKFDSATQKVLLDAAAEIEGSEEAYAVLVREIQALREKLAHTENNLRATIALVPCTPLA